jgi:AcrR family transcriptional regulator
VSVSSSAPPEDRRRSASAARRRKREAEILAATRALFDKRGVRDAQIEDVARAVGVNRAIIYRHFTGKEELFALTVVGYLEELAARLSVADDATADPETRLRALTGAFFDYAMEYPAFVDCAQTLMRRPGDELLGEVSEAAVFRLGRAINGCLTQVAAVIRTGTESGAFKSDDPVLLANTLYAVALGGMQLARVGVLVTEAAPGIPAVASVAPGPIRAYLVDTAVALARG